MRSRLFLTVVLLAAAVAALSGALVAAAGAENTGELPDLTASELITRMADPSGAPDAISGEIFWTNELFGHLPFVPDHVAEPAASPLTASGSGRMWAQDGKLRLESQGQGGDQVLVADAEAGTVWTYTFVTDTVHLYRWTGERPDEDSGVAGGSSAMPSPGALTPERVSVFLQAAARVITVDVTGQAFVAGRDAYLLTMTPAASDTALGKIEAAIDGHTFVPLRAAVVARGHDEPTLAFGFTRVSYDQIDESVFAFAPPAGAAVERDTIDPPADKRDAGATDAPAMSDDERVDAAERIKELARTALLTREEAADLVDFRLAWAREYAARDYRWAYVIDDGVPVDALGAPVFDMAKAFGGDATVPGHEAPSDDGSADATTGPVAVLLYGEGFGSIVLAETKTTPEIREQLKQLPDVVSGLDLGETEAKAVVTPLGSVVVWERDGVTLVAAGMVPHADIVAFVGSVR